MSKKILMYCLQIIIALGLWYVFVYTLDLLWVFVAVLAVIAVLFVVFNRNDMYNGEQLLEIACSAPKYLEYLDRKQEKLTSDSEINKSNLQRAYAHLYNGENEEAKLYFNRFEFDEFEEDYEFVKIYYRVKARLAFIDKDEKELRMLLDEVASKYEEHFVLKDYCKILALLLREDYENAIAVLIDSIPAQERRVHIIELEYYLGYAYDMFEQKEDALAVLGFVIKKNFNVVFTKLSDEIYERLIEEN